MSLFSNTPDLATTTRNAPLAERKEEAELADGWFHTITSEVFG